MLMSSPKQEAELIIEPLFDKYGTGGETRGECPWEDGRDAILEMKDAGFPGWQEVEWAGFYIKYLIQKACEEGRAGELQPYDQKRRKRHLVKGNCVWDARFYASDSDKIILGGVDEYGELVNSHGGVGILIVDAVANSDLNGDFRRWHEELKGGSSEYSLEREMEGRPVRPRKTNFYIKKALAYFFTPEDLQKGLAEGWIDDRFQRNMRNADGSSRSPKYRLKISLVPNENLVAARNFNEEPEEFEEDFPGYS